MVSIWIAVAAAALLGETPVAEEPTTTTKRYKMIAPMADGLNAVAINGRGDVAGFHWEPEGGDPNVLYEAPFVARGGEIVRLPLLETYTATFPAGIGDDGTVVGRASKPAPLGARVHLRNQAFVWTAADGIRGLGAPAPDAASFATGISRDGRRVAGIGVGPGGPRAVLWERDRDAWRTVIVPGGDALNSNVLAISPNGKRLAAVRRSKPALWTENAAGAWEAESLDAPEDHFIPRGVNDAGTVVGFRNDHDGTYRAVVWTRGEGTKVLSPPPGFIHAQASAVNNAGAVVGQVDGPHGRLPGPRAFVAERGEIRILDEGGPDFTWATAINDVDQVTGVLEREEEAAEAPEPGPEPEPEPLTPR